MGYIGCIKMGKRGRLQQKGNSHWELPSHTMNRPRVFTIKIQKWPVLRRTMKTDKAFSDMLFCSQWAYFITSLQVIYVS